MFRTLCFLGKIPFLIFILNVFSINPSCGQEITYKFFDEKTTDSEKIECLKRFNWEGALKSDSLQKVLDDGVVLASENNELRLKNSLKIKQIQFSDKTLDEKITSLNSIKKNAQKQKWDSIYIVAEHVICQSLSNNNKKDEALKRWFVLEEHERLKKGDFHYVHESILIEIGLIYSSKRNFQEAIDMFQESLKIANRFKNRKRISDLYNSIGTMYNRIQQFDSARKYISKAILLGKEINQPYSVTLGYLNLATSYGMAGNYDSCLVYSLLLEEMVMKHDYTQLLLFTNDNIAACYMSLKNPKKALPYQLKAYGLLESTPKITNRCRQALNVGLCYVELKDFENAEKYYVEALEIGESINVREKANVLTHLVFLYINQGDLVKAKGYCLKLEKVLPEVSESHLSGEIQRCLAQYYKESNQNQKSNIFANQAIKNITSFENLAKIYQIKAINHEALSENDSAIIAYRLYIANQDSFQRQSDEELEQTILAKYSVEKAENQAQIATMDKEISELNTKKERRMKLFGFLLLSLSLVSILLIVSRHRKFLAEKDKTLKLEKESAKALLERSRSALESQSELMLSKNRLIEDLKQNLTRLFNEASLDTAEVKNFLDSKILTKEDWDKFKASFTVVHPTFINSASETYPTLTASELRLLCLAKLGMNKQEIADMLGVLPDSVKRTTNRFIQKISKDGTLSLKEVVETIK